MPPKPKRAAKWNEGHKALFRQHIKNKRINPKNTNTKYIDEIHKKYLPDCPKATFCNNYKASVSEWQVGQAIKEANKASAAKAAEGVFWGSLCL
jgi:hypothetical protein